MNHSYPYEFAKIQLVTSRSVQRFMPYEASALRAEKPVVRLCRALEPFAGDDSRETIHHAFLTVKSCPEGWEYTIPGQEDHCVLRVSRDYSEIRVWQNPEKDPRKTELCFQNLLQTALECASIRAGALSLHCACVEKEGQAFAFTAASGTGKSTRARAWEEALGAAFISGDRPQIVMKRDGVFACGVPWDGKEQIFRNVQVPLHTVMEIRRGAFTRVRRITVQQKTRVLLQQCFIPMWDTETAAIALHTVRRLAKTLHMVRVFCGPDAESARQIFRILTEHPEEIEEEKQDMKVKSGFILREVMDEFLIMPTGDNIGKFGGTVVLNEVSAFIWEKLQNPIAYEDVLAAVLSEYEIDEVTARKDLDALLDRFRSFDLMEEM